MSEISPKQVAANQSNALKSTGPKTALGKARASLNALKTGAYAKTELSLRQLMLRRGEDPEQYDQLQQNLMDAWQPDDVMQGMLVKNIAQKSWDKLQLRSAWLESQLTAIQLASIQAERRQLLKRRSVPGAPAVGSQGLWQAKPSWDKFTEIIEILDLVQGWLEAGSCPDDYQDVISTLYGDCPSLAGQRIQELFTETFDEKNDYSVREKAQQELPKWIAQEKRDVQQERELYRREWELRRRWPNLSEEQVAAKESALDRQIGDQTRLLLQLKSKRCLWPSRSQAGEAAPAGENPGLIVNSGEKSLRTGANGEEMVAPSTIGVETAPNGQTKPLETLESTT